MYQIIAVDLDGTLLSSDNQITEYTKKIIKLLLKKNFYFVLASGRHYIDVLEIRDILKIKSFMITSNGAKIYNLDNKLIFSSDIEKDIVLKICNMVYSDPHIVTQIYQNDQWYINNNKIENNFCPALTNLKHKYFFLDNFNFINISKIFFTSKNYKKLCYFEKKIIENYNHQVNVSFSVPGCLEVISKKTSKGYGLKLISNLIGIPLDNFISFGDGMNDEDMLCISGKAYIMQNADPRLKAVLPKINIIGSNDNNGVARCLYEMFIKK